MSTSASADPVRIEVEATLRRVLDDVSSLPCAALRRATRTARRSVDRVSAAVETPIGVARSLVELTLNGVLGGGGSKVPVSAPVPPIDESRPARIQSADSPTAAVIDGDPDDASSELPLHGYESLAASQVVARLSRLSPAELELIRAFELAHRGRRTILGKIEQLLSGA